MDKIIGLGKAGCNIARAFERYTQYDVYKLDHRHSSEMNYYVYPKHDNPEAYDDEFPDLEYFFKYLSGEALFITCGGSKISAASLRVLQQVKNKAEINVLYIKPDISELSGSELLNENAVFNVFQEYARSGVFKSLIIVENKTIETVLGGLPVFGYFDRINETIVSVLHMLNVFDNTEAVLNTYTDLHDPSRICTIGTINPKNGNEYAFYDLKEVREKKYYFAVPEDHLKSDQNLLKNIRENVDQDCHTTFGIYSTNYEDNHVYFLARTTNIQKNI
jgi:hypothetical protein